MCFQICVSWLHSGVAKVLFPFSKNHHHWAGSASVSNDVQLEPENAPLTYASASPLGDPEIGKGSFEKNFPFAFSTEPQHNEMDTISEQQFRQAIHKIHIHLLAMEKVRHSNSAFRS